MADNDFFQDDIEDNVNDVYGFDDAFDDGSLSLLEQLETYLESKLIFHRQTVAQNILETLQVAGEDRDVVLTVLNNMARLSHDAEAAVRSDLMEQLPHIAKYSQQSPLLTSVVPDYILPVVVRYLTDISTPVRKTTQAALLVMMEQDLIKKEDIEHQVTNIILELASPLSHDDYRTEAVALMSKMAPLVGQDITERFFLPRFCQMLTDPLFHVRKVCAANFGEVCSVVSKRSSEQLLLPKLNGLCDDGMWGVRKACAECFMDISCASSLEMRRGYLAQLFVDLLTDQSRWVRMSAFQHLGPFISTFAHAAHTGLGGKEGAVVLRESRDQAPADTDGNRGSAGSVEDETVLAADQTSPTQPVLGDTVTDHGDGQSRPGWSSQHTGDSVSLEDLSHIASRICNLSLEEGSSHDQPPTQPSQCSVQTSDNSSCDTCSQHSQSSALATACSSETGVCSGDTMQWSVAGSSGRGQPAPCPTDSSFDSFHYWRLPLPSIDEDLDQLAGESHNIHAVKLKEEDHSTPFDQDVVMLPEYGDRDESQDSLSQDSMNQHSKSQDSLSQDLGTHELCPASADEVLEVVREVGVFSLMNDSMDQYIMEVEDAPCEDVNDNHLHYMDEYLAEKREDDVKLAQQQDIVPQCLLENYLGMIEPSRAQTVDSDIARHCAYNLPAVAYTLGRQNWHCIKRLYETLATATQWKVRRTLAFSIHEMGQIEGEEITQRDLLPIFNLFLRDLDDVRIGVLNHLADFLKLLQPSVRQRYLPKLRDFLHMDNHKNWRFREELARQLTLLCDLYGAVPIAHYITPLAVDMCHDKVATVRILAMKLMSSIVRRIQEDGEEKLLYGLCTTIANELSHSTKWLDRQLYCRLCRDIVEDHSLPPPLFIGLFLPSLLSLATDGVANVRLNLAKTLTQTVLLHQDLVSGEGPHVGQLRTTLTLLQSDKDRDVAFYAVSHHCPQFSSLLDHNADTDQSEST